MGKRSKGKCVRQKPLPHRTHLHSLSGREQAVMCACCSVFTSVSVWMKTNNSGHSSVIFLHTLEEKCADETFINVICSIGERQQDQSCVSPSCVEACKCLVGGFCLWLRLEGPTSSVGCSVRGCIGSCGLNGLVRHDSGRKLLLSLLKAGTGGAVQCVHLKANSRNSQIMQKSYKND